MNWKKLRSPSRATLTKFNFQSLYKLGNILKYNQRPAFKNPNFKSKDELKNAMSQFGFHC